MHLICITGIDMKEVLVWGDREKQYIEDMRWVGKHIVRQGNLSGEDIILVVIPLKEWQEKCKGYPIYKEIAAGSYPRSRKC